MNSSATSARVDDEAVNKTIDTIVKQRVTFTKEEGRQAAAEDRLTVNFTGTINGEEFQGGKAEGFSFVLGQGRMLPEFEDAATGMGCRQKRRPLSSPFPGKLTATRNLPARKLSLTSNA